MQLQVRIPGEGPVDATPPVGDDEPPCRHVRKVVLPEELVVCGGLGPPWCDRVRDDERPAAFEDDLSIDLRVAGLEGPGDRDRLPAGSDGWIEKRLLTAKVIRPSTLTVVVSTTSGRSSRMRRP
ncbi:hypothetical protein GCM10009868_31250 [Terrabacter aerolatus]|uniref:Uncharacterized protein n=1 Tax=Terrabacter aerolatus TaxID=422442 RepID=A0A512CYZ2_9MICO|nr:hypothetical protein TAE01_12420 [Terrabacter aerolatus]